MELRQLEMLLAVAEEGSYVQAGKRLNISHSAIHRQIRLLEEEVRERVMVRTGRNVEVTEAGKLLVSLARRVERDITHTSAEVRELSNLQSGTLRIGTGTRTIFNRFDCKIRRHIVHKSTLPNGTSKRDCARPFLYRGSRSSRNLPILRRVKAVRAG
jgi:molybdenum-dependent DNA-binding transcriptional regulator ModE